MAGDGKWESGFRPEWQPLQENDKAVADPSKDRSARKGMRGGRKPAPNPAPANRPVDAPSQPPLQSRSSSIWPALAGAFGTALVFVLGLLGWLLLSGDGSENNVAAGEATSSTVASESFSPTGEEMELGAEQLRVMLRGMNLPSVDVEIRESVLYLVGTVPNDAAFADAMLAAGALPSVNQVNFTELESEDSAGFGSTEAVEPDVVGADADAITVSAASLEDQQALQAEIDRVLAEIPIRFAAGNAEPDDLVEAVLQTALVSLLENYPGTQVMLAGYTDESGAAEDNLSLSEQRAEAVRSLLVERGIAGSRLIAVGRGSANSTGDEALDRRVEIEVMSE